MTAKDVGDVLQGASFQKVPLTTTSTPPGLLQTPENAMKGFGFVTLWNVEITLSWMLPKLHIPALCSV